MVSKLGLVQVMLAICFPMFRKIHPILLPFLLDGFFLRYSIIGKGFFGTIKINSLSKSVWNRNEAYYKKIFMCLDQFKFDYDHVLNVEEEK